MRPQSPPELGQLREISLTEEERAAQLPLQTLNSFGQRRLRDVACLSRPREVKRLTKRQEVADFVELHV